ncbi:MAG: amidohydrolase family protein, partial [Anaerolineae bacterium]|nr:amidohydrolase family protein [Anaerolineae bacterium]
GWDWCSVADYLARFDGAGASNVAYLVPHGVVRYEVMGTASRPPTPGELAQMKRLVAQGMEEGAVGLSTGLGYVPGQYAQVDELVGLSRTAAEYGGVYVSHIRDYLTHIDAALEEIFTIGAQAQIPIHISHFVGHAPVIERTAAAAQARGLEMTYDVYPYLLGSTSLFGILTQLIVIEDWTDIAGVLRSAETRALLHRALAAWDWSTLTLSYVPGHEDLEGRNLQACAEEAGAHPIDYMCDLIAATDLAAGVISHHTFRTEDDLKASMQPRTGMFSSDGIFLGSRPNPRAAGTFPRVLARYVREQGALALEDAIRKMTSLPAQTHRLHDRGLLKVGLAADVVIFDPGVIQDHATFEDGRRLATGMDFVIVNGKIVLDEGRHTGATPGRALRPYLRRGG